MLIKVSLDTIDVTMMMMIITTVTIGGHLVVDIQDHTQEGSESRLFQVFIIINTLIN